MNTIDRLGVSKLEFIFAKKGWFFREQFIKDYGIDAQVEIVNEDKASGELIAIQIKSGLSYFSEIKGDSIIFRPENKHVEYWKNHSLPVIIVLYNPESDLLFWSPVTNETLLKSKNSYKIEISKSNILNHKNCNSLKKVFRLNVSRHRFNRLLFDRGWMELINKGGDVYAEFIDYINKSLSRTSIKIYYDYNEKHFETNTPIYYTPGASIFGIVKNLIPWADLEMDLESHEESMRDDYETECYITYDKEDDRTYYSQKFEDWYEEPDDIVPIQTDGESSIYKVKLVLNDLGRSFLTLMEFISDDLKFEHKSFTSDEL